MTQYFRTLEEFEKNSSIEGLRKEFEDRGLEYSISEGDRIASAGRIYLKNCISELKGFFGYSSEKTDVEEFLKDSYIYEKAIMEYSSLKNASRLNEFFDVEDTSESPVISKKNVPGYEVSLGEKQLHLRGFPSIKKYGLSNTERTEFTRAVLNYRNSGTFYIMNNAAQLLPPTHRRLKWEENQEHEEELDTWDELFDMNVEPNKSAEYPVGVFEGFKKYCEIRKSTEKLNRHAEGTNDWVNELERAESMELPLDIERSYLQKWFPRILEEKHERVKNGLKKVFNDDDFHDSEDVYVVGTIEELPVFKQYTELFRG